jgi:serine/threonine-protein kinase RsbW
VSIRWQRWVFSSVGFGFMTSRESRNMEKTQTTLESTLESVDKAEAIVVAEAAKAGLDEDEQGQVGMAIRECMVNAVVHGNRYNKNKKVHLEIERTNEALTIVIGDEGQGFDMNSLPDPLAPENLLRQSGRGLLLIRAFMDEFDLHPRPGGGTEVRLVKHLPKP